MKAAGFSLRRFSLLLLIPGIAAIIAFFQIRSQDTVRHARALSNALTNARSVTLIEFERGLVGPELVFNRLAASPQQIAALHSATGWWFAPIPRGRRNCLDPHHRVEIVRADGSTLRLDNCFHCQN